MQLWDFVMLDLQTDLKLVINRKATRTMTLRYNDWIVLARNRARHCHYGPLCVPHGKIFFQPYKQPYPFERNIHHTPFDLSYQIETWSVSRLFTKGRACRQRLSYHPLHANYRFFLRL